MIWCLSVAQHSEHCLFRLSINSFQLQFLKIMVMRMSAWNYYRIWIMTVHNMNENEQVTLLRLNCSPVMMIHSKNFRTICDHSPHNDTTCAQVFIFLFKLTELFFSVTKLWFFSFSYSYSYLTFFSYSYSYS